MVSNVTPLELARELQRRRQIRRSFAAWCRFCGFEPARHHLLLIDKLEAVAAGRIQRLAIFMPPGSGKSIYASVLFPPWLLAMTPKVQILAASATTQLACEWGRRVRKLVSDHRLLLGISLAREAIAGDCWELDRGHDYHAVGAGAGTAWGPVDFVIIDDPIGARQDADSQRVRNRIWDWYKSDVSPRMKPSGRQILIQSRWHTDDLAGRLLAEIEMVNGGYTWEILTLPAEAEANDPLGREPGQFLWEDGDYDYAGFLREQKAMQPPGNWLALYQQRPTRPE
jgi:hypothetical protein